MTDLAITFRILKAISSGISFKESWEIKSNVTLLTRSHLNAAIDIVNQAQISETEFKSLMADAISEFTRALKIEKKNRLIISYLGLAFCYQLLEDKNKIREILIRLLKDDLWSELNKRRDWVSRPYEPITIAEANAGAIAAELSHQNRYLRLKELLELETEIKKTIDKL